ncbi:homeobox protein CDX-1a [Salarias fasciatus]|uniref:homeobox protein CDX-1a n=1 Tax=Salarias fasciatus TaxID=181472 RepID=UPI001176D094|nr:homeobox protein CDX-1 [Salarias fasciatus]
MYANPQSVRQQAQTLSLNSQYIPPPYDFTGYHHHVPGLGDPPPASAWNHVYTGREEFPFSFQGSSPGVAPQVSFSSPDLSGPPSAPGGGSFQPFNFVSGQDPFSTRRRVHEPVKHSISGGKTRTKDKYRVVYSDHQRLELEKEFQFNRYITMRRKSELSMALSLSERQVKIWFQNRRAKERKLNRKKLQHSQQASTTTPTPPVLGGPTDAQLPSSPGSNILSDTVSEEY